ncbi:MAG: hypothetical protein HFE45_03165 [Oscillospiraceae bacterium]|nr:hypothetical protein [Oscillospiraceae bacterium]
MELSLHVFMLWWLSGKNKVSTGKDLLALIGIDERLSNEVAASISQKCCELGRKGWVLSPFWMPHDGETWVNTWYDNLQNNNEEIIVEYFKNNNFELLNNIRRYTRFEVENPR